MICRKFNHAVFYRWNFISNFFLVLLKFCMYFPISLIMWHADEVQLFNNDNNVMISNYDFFRTILDKLCISKYWWKNYFNCIAYTEKNIIKMMWYSFYQYLFTIYLVHFQRSNVILLLYTMLRHIITTIEQYIICMIKK